MSSTSLVTSDLSDSMHLLAQGKVRDLYEINSSTLLFVTTDRISAYDVVMGSVIPNKGSVLCLLSVHWFRVLSEAIPSLRTHFLTLELPPQIPSRLYRQYYNRCMQVRKFEIFQIEAIVRGYITGSAWSSYKNDGTVCGINIQEGLQESEPFPDGPIYTPSTKAVSPGDHDENIHPDQAAMIVGTRYAKRIEELSLSLYKCAASYALERGIVIADTKFEFGLDKDTDEVVLVDEVLTPDSSRFWPASSYRVGESPPSFDKQHLRDWLTSNNLKGQENVLLPEHLIRTTEEKYNEAYKRLVGRTLDEDAASITGQ
ncbi:MAG: hypothetical protein LQ351_004893 [Letrouitia transgressa]|nr:MAG: hypothetical protein LQ351_004893 [Letrouitia transgressa]